MRAGGICNSANGMRMNGLVYEIEVDGSADLAFMNLMALSMSWKSRLQLLKIR